MKIKILSIAVFLILFFSYFVSADSHVAELDSGPNILEVKEVKIAMLAQERGWDCRDLEYFKEMLPDYEWVVNSTKYRFKVDLILDKDILSGNLKVDNYDVLLIAGGAVGDAEAMIRWIPNVRNFIWKRSIANFIKNGGGYFSDCGGTTLITDLDHKPTTPEEMVLERSAIDGISCVKTDFQAREPLLCQLLGDPPKSTGMLGYILYSGWNLSSPNANPPRNGIPLDYQINTNHPIFDDYLKDTRRISWIGGPGLVVPENPDREVTVLARFPVEEISENESTQVHVWEYQGGFRGVFKGIFKGFKDRENLEFTNPFIGAYTHAEDWDPMDKILETNFSNKPAITAEIYPNENQGRLLLCSPHTERNIWWGGHVQESVDTDHNNLFEGLWMWVDIIPNPWDLERTYNYWLNRRCIAWAGKVADNDLPPVYGPSQICDIYPYNQSSEFTVTGNAEVTDRIESLDLYYRYSSENETWTPWILYETDFDVSDGWSWEFSPLDGVGYYEFYSIRHVEYEHEWLNEAAPPGPDAIARVVD